MSSFLHLLSIFTIIPFSKATINDDIICNDENKADQLSTQQAKPNEAIKNVSLLKGQYEKLTPLNKQTSSAVSQSKQESHPNENSPKKLLSKDKEEINTPQIDNKLSQEPDQTQQTSSNQSHELPSTKRKFRWSLPSWFKFGKQSSESKITNIENPNTSDNNEFTDTLSPTPLSLEKVQDDSEENKLDDQEKELTTTNTALLPKTSPSEIKPPSTSYYKQTYLKNINKVNKPNNYKHNNQPLITDREFAFDEIKSKLEGKKHDFDQAKIESEQTSTLNSDDNSSENNTKIISTSSTDDPTSRSPTTHQVKASTPSKKDSSSRYYLIIGVVIISILILISIVFFLYSKKN